MAIETPPSFPQAALDSWILLCNGSVSTPTPGVSLVLPVGYKAFHLRLLNVRFDAAGDSLTAAFSFDGGAHYLYDTVNTDAYFMIGYETLSTVGGVTVGSAPVGVADTLISLTAFIAFFTQPTNPLFGIDVLLNITQGSDTELTRVAYRSIAADSAANGKFAMASVTAFVLGPAATVPVAPAAATNILIQSYGDGSAPQTGGSNITAMDYILFGVR